MIFSIIIATCDRPERLAKALDAVAAAIRTHGEEDRIIVIDNGGAHSAEAVVKDFAGRSGLLVRYVLSEPRNKAKALNAGVAAADTDWLAFTDDDCLPGVNWLKEADAYLKRTGRNIFGGRIVPGTADFPLPRWLRPEKSGKIRRGPAFVEYTPLSASGVLDNRVTVPFGEIVFVRNAVFEKYGGYDEALWQRCGKAALGSEDAEFAMRVRAGGEPVGYCAEAVVVHPVYRERVTLKYYLRSSYWTGIREPILFPDDRRKAPVFYLFRRLLIALLRCAWCLGCGNSAASARELMNAVEAWGQIRGRKR